MNSRTTFAIWALLCAPAILPAQPVPVRYLEGAVQGFLALRNSEGKLLASGQLTQVVTGDRVVARLIFHFKDGSLSDETTVFTERRVFHLLSDHLIQKGPAFPKPVDMDLNAATGKVTVRYRDKDREKVDSEHMDLPDDLANGAILDIIKNIPAADKETTLSYLAATPKPRLVKMDITAPGEESFSAAGWRYKAIRYNIKIAIGGIAGIIAPFIGKQPSDINVWIASGAAPAFVKIDGPMFLGGPNWTVEMTSPVWPSGQR